MIRKKIKSVIAVLITTVLVYVTYDNLQRIEAERSLPVGVTEIKITDWTKTREPNEISGCEKKLNSHSDLADLNKNISAEDVDSLEGLYNDSDELRNISDVTRSEVESDAEDVESNAVNSSEVVNHSDNTEEIVENKVDNTAVEDITDMDKSTNTNTNIDTDTNNETQETIDIKITDNKENNTDKSSATEKPSVTVAENNSNTEGNNKTAQVGITGNKVLRTIINKNGRTEQGKFISYNINTLYEYLKSDKPINWKDDNTITWDLYTEVDSNNEKSSVEWRMLSAKINISKEQKVLLEKGQAVLGIPANNEYGFELIIPYNDIISVFINGKTTTMNYQNRLSIYKYKINNSTPIFKKTLNTCSDEIHKNILCKQTEGSHADTELLNESNIDCIDADISKNLNEGENTIDILVGNIITNEASLSKVHGFSKLNLYIIEKPVMEASMQFYKNIDGEIINFDSEYTPKLDEKVLVRVDVKNNSQKYDLYNLNVEIGFGQLGAGKLRFTINSNKAVYKSRDITNKIRCYINEDFSKEYTIEALKKLEIGDNLTIISDEMDYTIIKQNVVDGVITPFGTFKANYIRDNLVHGYEVNKDKYKQKRIQISREHGIFNFTCEIENDNSEEIIENESFIVNISSDNEFANLEIQPGKTSTVKNLNTVGTDYYINLIVPQNYEVVDTDTYSSAIQNKVRLTQNSTVKNIHIKLKRKNNNYFYKNQQGRVNIKVE